MASNDPLPQRDEPADATRPAAVAARDERGAARADAGSAAPERRRRWLRVVLPLAVLALGAAGFALMLALRPTAETRPPRSVAPLVRVQTVEPRSLDVVVTAQGTVVPRTESELVPEVSGRVTWVSPALAAGGFFEAGEPLLRLDPRDYQVAVDRARAAVQRAESEHRLAAQNLERRQALSEQGVVSDTVLDQSRNAERVAHAALLDARAALTQARLDLERTELRAPYEGRVRSKSVDLGQFVSRGAPVARLYAVDRAEVRLPIPDADLEHLDLGLGFQAGEGAGPEVTLHATLAGEEHSWPARIVRSEGEIDPRTRMLHAVAQVEDPYGRDAGAPDGRPPLAVGLFVTAEISGRRLEDVVVLPRSALRGDGTVHVVDADGRLRVRPVEVLRADRSRAVIGEGLSTGDRVVRTPLEGATDGMAVRVLDTAGDAPPGA